MSKYLNQLQTYAYTDILGWSNSRQELFRSCKRKYFYEYYAKHDASNTTKIYKLKSLTSVPLEIGTVTHKILETLLKRLQKSVEPIDQEKLFEYTIRQVQVECSATSASLTACRGRRRVSIFRPFL